MSGRPKIYDENIALKKATEVFWEKGYEASSSNELLAAMGIGKGSFYLAYKNGKQELFEKSLQYFFLSNVNAFLQSLKSLENPVAAIKGFYLSIVDDELLQKNGCYFCNTVMKVENDELKELAGKKMKEIAATFSKVLIKAKKSGIINLQIPEEILDFYLINLWSGLNVMRQIENDPLKTRKLIEEHFKMIQ